MKNSIAILDFGSQYSQLIARRVREAKVYCELFPWNTSSKTVLALQPKGLILSGGPASVYAPGAPQLPEYVLQSSLPVLGICYGMQALTHKLGGVVRPSTEHEYGSAELQTTSSNPLIPIGKQLVWMSHGDSIETPPQGFIPLASTINAPIAAMGDPSRHLYGVQFHPEVHHTPHGPEIIRRFLEDICGITPDWTPESIISQKISHIKSQVGGQIVLSGVSGGVDSSVATALVHKAVGNQLVAVFVDTGLLRLGEADQVIATFQKNLGIELIVVDAKHEFLEVLRGIIDPEQKRRRIGEKFIRVFEDQAQQLGKPRFLVQGTIYPDVVESSDSDRSQSARIKSHHNVGGLPEDMDFELVEPLRTLFKDEVRTIGTALNLPSEIIDRQPFPGPGLAVRCLGEVTRERLDKLQAADAIFRHELSQAGLLQTSSEQNETKGTSQAFAVLLPVSSVGVMGDERTYQETIALRAITTEDFMTADWARLDSEILARISNRIVNEVDGINRIVYDITSKPPATIEWE
jgi:GMP synthase (glutamine-hydrolysing)